MAMKRGYRRMNTEHGPKCADRRTLHLSDFIAAYRETEDDLAKKKP